MSLLDYLHAGIIFLFAAVIAVFGAAFAILVTCGPYLVIGWFLFQIAKLFAGGS